MSAMEVTPLLATLYILYQEMKFNQNYFIRLPKNVESTQ